MDSIDSQIIMKELMKGPNKRGREDFLKVPFTTI